MHQPVRRRRAIVLLLGVLVVIAGIAISFGLGEFNQPKPLTPAQMARQHPRFLAAAESKIASLAEANSTASLPVRPNRSAPATPSPLFVIPPQSHVVFGYLPYWLLGSVTAQELSSVSKVGYFALSVSDSGGIERFGPGFAGLSSSAFSRMLTTAHGLGDRVDLTLSTTSVTAVSALLRRPAASGTSLANQLESFVRRYGFDGVALDLEGRAASERQAFVTFVTNFSRTFKAALPTDELVLDTYPQSAGNSQDFFNVGRLAPQVDQLFVMAYDMLDPSHASSNDPLLAKNLGLSDVQSLLQYVAVVPRGKLILGMPYYGYDFSTSSSLRAAPSVTSDPEAVLYSAVVQAGHRALWDVTSATPYAVFLRNGQWHQTFYDDPVSLSIKTSLATDFRIEGVGMWALGYQGSAAAMLQALSGGAPPRRS